MLTANTFPDSPFAEGISKIKQNSSHFIISQPKVVIIEYDWEASSFKLGII